MKRFFMLAPVLALAVFASGCANNRPMTKAVYTLAVSSGVQIGSDRYPEAVPYIRVANPIICAAASGTNVSPAAIVAAIQNSPVAEAAATPNGKMILNGALILYGALFETGGGAVDNAEAREWLQWTCDAINLGLPPVASPATNTARSRALSPRPSLPHLK